MKQTEIYYKEIRDEKGIKEVEIVQIANVLNHRDLDAILTDAQILRYFQEGISYNATVSHPNTIFLHIRGRIGLEHDFTIEIGDIIPIEKWNFFQNFLRGAGERFTEIHKEEVIQCFEV